jgi:hypothetical protein
MRRDLGSQLILIASQRDPKLLTDKFLAPRAFGCVAELLQGLHHLACVIALHFNHAVLDGTARTAGRPELLAQLCQRS